MTNSKKPKMQVGIFNVTGCAGCLLSIIFNEDDLLNIVELIAIKAFPFIKESSYEGDFDMVIVEGTPVQPEDIEELVKIRNRTKVLVALGACATHGGAPALRNFIPNEQFQHLTYHKASHLHDIPPRPVDGVVKVDYYLPGCPPDKKEILNFIKTIALGKEWRSYSHPVCKECRHKENRCLLDDGKLCLGPITMGNCDAVCPSGGLECWGCRGLLDDANLHEMVVLLKEKGFDTDTIKERLETFVGLKVKGIQMGKKWLEEH